MQATIITNYWKNSDGGGIKTYLVNLADALKNKSCNIDILFRQGDDPEQYHEGKNKVLFSLNCFKQLQKINPDIIYSQGAWYCLLPGVFYKKIYGCTLVHTFHTEPTKKLPIPAKMFVQNLLNACDCVTFVSKRLQERIVELDNFSFPETKITYSGTFTKKVSKTETDEFRKQYKINGNSKILLALGMTALQYKAEGLKVLIKAIQILRDTYPNIVLIATRDGKYINDVKLFAHEIGVEKNIIFTGDVPNPYTPLQICDIYTQITFGEGGVSVALLEAMAMGKPIIATSVGGIPEAISDGINGLLVEPKAEDVAEKIELLLKDQEFAQKLGRSAQKTASERFTWGKTANEFLQIYNDSY